MKAKPSWKRIAWSLATVVLISSLTLPLSAAGKEPAPTKLKIGDQAPDFKLQYFDGNDLKDVSLSQYRGKKNVALAFYIFAFTGG
jgi:peroxiredoxin